MNTISSRHRALAFVLLSAMTGSHAGGWVDERGVILPERENMRSASNFLVQLRLTPDEAALRKTWEEASSKPALDVSERIPVGRPITTVLTMTGCTPNPAGQCDVMAEFSIVAPDGERTRLGAGYLWKAAPLTPRFMLGNASVTLVFREKDKGKAFRMIATVEDRVASKVLELSTPLTVE
ncbi:hypothetical protein [Zoogloea sp.]|uniref:hypothetical protein n=1 Tax=Zoogloea sp. TaxID=49181 RepID=UPI0035B07C17